MAHNELTVIPIKSKKRSHKFELGEAVLKSIKTEGQAISEGDIVVVSSKFAAMAEGRYFDLKKITPSKKGRILASRYRLDPSLAELIVQESEAVLGGIPGFALAVSKGVLAPNAGIDRSNVLPGFAILYPENPVKTARTLRSYIAAKVPQKGRLERLGVILSDSRITPTRRGTIGIAVATSGFKPVIDFRGKRDLFGNKLKVTMKAVADQLSSAAQLAMGEAAESIPIAIIRGYNADFEEERSLRMTIPYKQCLYIQGLKNESQS